MNSGIWMFWLVRVNWVKQDKLCQKIGQKLGENQAKILGEKFGNKIGQKNGQKFGKIIKCDHTNSARQFVVIEFTNLVEFMKKIE